VANFHHATNSSRHRSVLFSAYRDLDELLQAYTPYPSYDDMAWYAMAYTRIFDVWRTRHDFLQAAINIHDWIWQDGWDANASHACKGFWWDNRHGYKASITNAQMLLLSIRLHRLHGHSRLSGHASFSARANQTWSFIRDAGMIDPATQLAVDAVAADGSCAPATGGAWWTYTQGTLVAGLAEAVRSGWPVVAEQAPMMQQAVRTADAVITTFSIGGILAEISCENLTKSTCNRDQQYYKGIFVRSLRDLVDAIHALPHLHIAGVNAATARRYEDWLADQAAAVATNSSCNGTSNGTSCYVVYANGPSYFNASAGPVYTADWACGRFDYAAPMQQAQALDLFSAVVPTGVKCRGAACAYDPPIPPYPPPVTGSCSPNPCPPGEVCCHSPGYFTCCSSGQTCDAGFCANA